MPRTTTSLIESIGVFLPPRRVSTREILAGCRNPVRVPLERVTGIEERPRAGDGLYSIDLAMKAVEDCLAHSRHAPEAFDLIVCCNISRYDKPKSVVYEPATAVRIKSAFGCRRALAIDISNACAGMWTGVAMADLMIRVGSIQRALIVSGEYITHLTDTAQQEISGHMDPQLASLTLGDAGVAISMERSPDPNVGMLDLDLYTLAKYSAYCVAKESNSPEFVAAMYTDPVKVTTSIVPLCASHSTLMLDRNQLSLAEVRHILPHQTSRLTMQDAIKEIAKTQDEDLSDRLINNLPKRGNTSSNSHFLAMHDTIHGETIQTDDLVLCSISGSGQTIGSALYRFDDLPSRLTGSSAPPISVSTKTAESDDLQETTIPALTAIAGIGTAYPKADQPADTLDLIEVAGEQCLRQSKLDREYVSLLLSVGTYRSEHLMEPAVAALVCDRLNLNVDIPPESEHRTFACDLINGSAGFLKGCFLTSQWITEGKGSQAMIVASEIENNRDLNPDHLLGLKEMASATLLEESVEGDTGFLAFLFRDYLDFLAAEHSHATPHPQGKCVLEFHQSEDIEQLYLDCIEKTVREFLTEQAFELAEIAWVLPPRISTQFTAAFADRLNLSPACIPSIEQDDADLRTSSTPVQLAALLDSGKVQPGDLGLFINVGAGIQVACALYQF